MRSIYIIVLVLKFAIAQIVVTDPVTSKKSVKPIWLIPNPAQQTAFKCFDFNQASEFQVIGGDSNSYTFLPSGNTYYKGWLGVKTSSNTGAFDDWDSMIFRNANQESLQSCRLTQTLQSLSRPLIFGIFTNDVGAKTKIYWFDPKDSTTSKINAIYTFSSLASYEPLPHYHYRYNKNIIAFTTGAESVKGCQFIHQRYPTNPSQILECYELDLQTQITRRYAANIQKKLPPEGATHSFGNSIYYDGTYIYLGIGFYISGSSKYACIYKFNPTDETDFSNIDVDYNPQIDQNDKGKTVKRCWVETYVHPYLNVFSQITKYSPSSRTVSVIYQRSYEQLRGNFGRKINFIGECQANSNVYYRVHIDQGYDQYATVIGLYAKSQTDNYIMWRDDVTGIFSTLYAAKIHFNPDTSNCGSGTYSSPLKITYKTIENICLSTRDCWYLEAGYFNGYMAYAGLAKGPTRFWTATTYRYGFMGGVHDDEFEAYTLQLIGTTTIDFVDPQFTTSQSLFKPIAQADVTADAGYGSTFIDADLTTLKDSTTVQHICAEKLKKKQSSLYVDNYLKKMYHNIYDTSGTQFNFIQNQDIFEVIDATNCPIQTCALKTFTAEQLASSTSFDSFFCNQAFTSTDVLIDATTKNIKVDNNKLLQVNKICIQCQTSFTDDIVKSNIFNIEVFGHPCNTNGIIYDQTKVIEIKNQTQLDLEYEVFVEYDGSRIPMPQNQTERWTANLAQLGIFQMKTVGAEDVGGCTQFQNTYSIAKVLKKDGFTQIPKQLWESFLTIDASTSLLQLENYSGASTDDFDEAQIFVDAKNSHFVLQEQLVAKFTLKLHPCNYKGFDYADQERLIKLSYTTWVPLRGDRVPPKPDSVKTYVLNLKDENILKSKVEKDCKIIDYRLTKVLKKPSDGAGENSLREQISPLLYMDIFIFDESLGRLKIQNYGGVDTKLFDMVTLVFRARTKYSLSDEYAKITVKIIEEFDIEVPPPNINYAPYFSNELKTIDLERDYKGANGTFQIVTFVFPEIEDFEKDDASLLIFETSLDKNWMIYQNGSKQISFDPNFIPSKLIRNGGEIIKIPILLYDNQTSNQTIDLKVNVKQKVIPPAPPTFVFVPQQKPKEIVKKVQKIPETPKDIIPLLAMILSVTNLGLVSIQFNQDIQQSLITSTDLDQFFEPTLVPGAYEKPKNFDFSQFDFTWEIVDYQKDKNLFLMQINFTNALIISQDSEFKDELYIKFKQIESLRSIAHNLSLDYKSRQIFSIIKKQMPNTQASKNFESAVQAAESSALFSTIIMFFLNMVFAGAINQIIGTIMGLMVVIHMGLLYLSFPGNISCFLTTLKPLASFNIIKQLSIFVKYVIPEDEEQQQANKKFIIQPAQDLGIQTHNTIANLTNIFFVQVLMIAAVLNLIVLRMLPKQREKYEAQKNSMFFGKILTLSKTGFIPMTIACFLGIQQPLYSTYGEKVSNAFTVLTAILIFIFYPIAMIANLLVPKEKLIQSSYKQKWGALYAGIETNTLWQRAFTLQFILRRFIILLVGFKLHQYPYFQLIIVTAVNFFSMVYIGQVLPFQAPGKDKIEVVNECLVIFMTTHCYCFTDAMQDVQAQYLMGWSFSGHLVIFLVGNGQFIIRDMFNKFKLLAIKYYRVTRRNLLKYYLTKRQSKRVHQSKKQISPQIIKNKSFVKKVILKVELHTINEYPSDQEDSNEDFQAQSQINKSRTSPQQRSISWVSSSSSSYKPDYQDYSIAKERKSLKRSQTKILQQKQIINKKLENQKTKKKVQTQLKLKQKLRKIEKKEKRLLERERSLDIFMKQIEEEFNI